MRNSLLILRHELRLMLLAPSTYVASVLFLSLMVLIYWTIIRDMTLVATETLPATDFFRNFWFPALFLVPLLTMRSIAEERRVGTLLTLLTTQVSPLSIVVGKFFAAYLFYCLLWMLTAFFPAILAWRIPDANFGGALLHPGPVLGGLLFVFLSGLLFVAIGIFASSLTRSQMVAGMLTFTLLFLVIVMANLLNNLPVALEQSWLTQWIAEPLHYLRITQHLEDFSRGIFDTRPVFYYSSSALLMLLLATLNVEARTSS